MLAVLATGATDALPRLGPAPNFALTTQQNDRIWLTQLRDRVVVLTFFCTTCASCPDVLPALLATSRDIGEAAGRRAFFVAVSVDPEHDTPAALRAFAHGRQADPAAWLFLTGTPAEVDLVGRRYEAGIIRGGGAVTHRCLVTLIDAAGVIRGRYEAARLDRLRGDLRALLPG